MATAVLACTASTVKCGSGTCERARACGVRVCAVIGASVQAAEAHSRAAFGALLTLTALLQRAAAELASTLGRRSHHMGWLWLPSWMSLRRWTGGPRVQRRRRTWRQRCSSERHTHHCLRTARARERANGRESTASSGHNSARANTETAAHDCSRHSTHAVHPRCLPLTWAAAGSAECV